MLILDLHFSYKYNFRFLLVQKLGNINNTFRNILIQKLFLYFVFTKLEDIHELELFNTFYLFKYFFGWNAFFSKTKSRFSLNKWYYSLNVRLILNKDKDIYKLLYLLINNIYINIDTLYIKKGIYSKKDNIFFYMFKDLSKFSEFKTNFGLIYLKQPLNLLIYLKGCNKNYLNNFLLLKNIKLFK